VSEREELLGVANWG